jgi:hypothetical protein
MAMNYGQREVLGRSGRHDRGLGENGMGDVVHRHDVVVLVTDQ